MKAWIRRIIFTLGLLIVLYPFASRAAVALYMQYQFHQMKVDSEAQYQRALALSKTANGQLNMDFSSMNLPDSLDGHLIGSVAIPSRKVSMPLFDNVSDDALKRGAGVVHGGSDPLGGKDKHTVISAHAGLPGKEFFSNLYKMKKGQLFLITVAGKTRAYKVDAIRTVKPTNVKHLQVEPGKDLATLLTCTPVPANTHRLLVRGHRVPYTPKVATAAAEAAKRAMWQNIAILAAIVAGLMGLITWLIWRHKKAKAAVSS